MKTKTIKRWEIEKNEVEHTFVAELVDQGSYVSLTLEGEYAEPDKINGQYVIVTDVILKPWNVKGISVDEELWNEISTALEEARAQKRKEYEEFLQRREADRPAPKIDEEKYYFFYIHPETYVPEVPEDDIHEEETYKEAVNRIIKKTKPKMAFKGSRDHKCEFPGTYDDFIPHEYVRKIDVGYEAEGYKNVWHEGTYYLPRQVVEIEAENVRKEIMEAKEKVEKEKQEKLAEARKKAKETGKPVILRKWVEECIDSDEECDIDIVYEVMLPSGKIEYQRHHTC